MPEELNEARLANDALNNPTAKFNEKLQSLRSVLSEVNDNYDELLAEGIGLIERYELSSELFDEPARALFFTAIVSRKIKSINSEADEEEGDFQEKALTALAYNYSPHFTDFKTEVDKDYMSDNPEKAKEIYDRYRDEKLSSELRELMEGPEFGVFRSSLGINSNAEADEYEVRVLNAAPTTLNNPAFFGIEPPRIDWGSLTPEATLRANADLNEAKSSLNNWKEHLTERGRQLAAELGQKYLSMGWQDEIDGVRTIFITEPMARKILEPAITQNSAAYTSEERARDIKIVGHEFGHAQGEGLNMDRRRLIGISLEEERVEVLADTYTYLGVRNFFADYSTITGESIAGYLSSLPKGGTKEEVYMHIAQQVGLSNMLEILMVYPDTYLTLQENETLTSFMNSVQTHLGGFNGVLEKILARERQKVSEEELEKRVNERLDFLLTKVSSNDALLNLFSDRKGRFGLEVVTDLLEKEANERGIFLSQP